MTIFLLKRIEETGYDEYEGFVVRAGSEEDARSLAMSEGVSAVATYKKKHEAEVWVSPELSSCDRVYGDGDVGILLGAFNAG